MTDVPQNDLKEKLPSWTNQVVSAEEINLASENAGESLLINKKNQDYRANDQTKVADKLKDKLNKNDALDAKLKKFLSSNSNILSWTNYDTEKYMDNGDSDKFLGAFADLIKETVAEDTSIVNHDKFKLNVDFWGSIATPYATLSVAPTQKSAVLDDEWFEFSVPDTKGINMLRIQYGNPRFEKRFVGPNKRNLLERDRVNTFLAWEYADYKEQFWWEKFYWRKAGSPMKRIPQSTYMELLEKNWCIVDEETFNQMKQSVLNVIDRLWKVDSGVKRETESDFKFEQVDQEKFGSVYNTKR